MATAKKTTTPRSATAKTATAKTGAAKTSAAKTGAAKTGATKATRKTATTRTRAARTPATSVEQGRTISLGSIDVNTAEVKALVTDSAYATLGAGDFVVEVARDLPTRLETLRKQRTERTAELVTTSRAKAETFVKDAEAFVKDAPAKLQAEVTENLEAARKELTTYADRGRKVIASITQAPTTKRALDQTETARTQVKGAVTSIRKAVEQSQDALEGAAGRIGARRSA